VQLSEVDDLLGGGHLRVEAAFLRHVPEPSPSGPAQRLPVPTNGPAAGAEHAEDDPHGGGLAGPVGADEPGHPPATDREGDVFEDKASVKAAADRVDLECTGHAADARCRGQPTASGARTITAVLPRKEPT